MGCVPILSQSFIRLLTMRNIMYIDLKHKSIPEYVPYLDGALETQANLIASFAHLVESW